MANWLEQVDEDLGVQEEFEPVLDPETGEVLYYKPTGKRSFPEVTPGTPPEKEEIPIPYVSLPDVVKPEIKPQPTYELMPPHIVPEAPAEQLEKLLPPVDKNAELEALNVPPVDVYETVAARTRRRAPARPPEEPPPEPPSDRSFVEAVTAPERLGAAKFLEHPGNLVYGIPAALAELLAGIEEQTPTEYVDPRTGEKIEGTRGGTARAVADWLKEAQAQSKRGVAKVTGTEGQKPVTPIEKLGAWMGEYAQPTKGVSAAATVGLAATGAAARGGLTTFGPEDVPIVGAAQAQGYDPNKALGPPAGGWSTPQGGATPPSQQPPVKVAPAPNAPVVPATMPPGSKTVPIVPPPMANVPYAPSAKPITSKAGKEKKEPKYSTAPVVPTGMSIPPPNDRKTAPPNIKRRSAVANRKTGERKWLETEEQFNQRFENAWVTKEITSRIYNKTASEVFETMAGLDKMSSTDYRAMGAIFGTLVALPMTGLFLRKFRKVELPVHRSVQDAAPGTAAISAPSDLARAYGDDITAALARIARRAGMDLTVLNRLMQRYRIQTRNGARALVDSAINEGRMDTPVFRFKAPVSLAEMAKNSSPITDEYLKALNRFEQLVIAQRPPSASTWNHSGKLTMPKFEPPKRIDGMTLDEARQAVRDIEAANPGIDKMAQANQGWNKAVRDFQYSGEYATLTKEEYDLLSKSHTNFVASKEGKNVINSQADDAKKLLKDRLDNEAIGIYVDETRRVDPSLFVKVSKEDLEANPAWRKNTISFMRNGETEHYTGDPMVVEILKTDHHTITNGGMGLIYGSKRLLESTTTGVLQQGFEWTSAMRSYWISKFTTEQGFKAPTIVGSVLAIPQQIVPQVARSISRGLDNGSFGFFAEALPPAWKEGFSRRMASVYEDSVYAQIKAAGSHRGSVLEQQQRNAQFQAATEKFNSLDPKNLGHAAAQHLFNGWKAYVEAVHNSVAFNYIRRNYNKPGEDASSLAYRARRLTGDPRTEGAYYGPSGSRIRFESDNKWDQRTADWLVNAYGWTAENVGKGAIPWWNATMQGAKRIGEAYLHDPIRFTRSTALYGMMPAATMFYYTKWLDMDDVDPNTGEIIKKGGDPYGNSYLDYMMNGRSTYNRQMNFYVPIPGRPAPHGAEITFFHELNPFRRAMEDGLHHMLGSNVPKDDPLSFFLSKPDNISARRSLKEDMHIAAWSFMDTAVIPPMPPIINAALGTMGIRGPQGAFGGEAFMVKKDPFNQNGGLPAALEISTRALAGGIAQSLSDFYVAATNSEGGAHNAIWNGVKQVRDTQIRRTPILRNVLDTVPDISNNTDLSKEVFDHQQEINTLSRFYKKWTLNEGLINTKGASIGGDIAATEQLGMRELNAANPGLRQPDPNNPLYIEFMDEFYRAFMKESPLPVKGEDQGGIAFKTMWRRYGQASQKLRDLGTVNHGSYDRWQRELPADAKMELRVNGVDSTNRQEVVNFYKKVQFDDLVVINNARRSVELIMSDRATERARAADPNAPPVQIRLKDLKPYIGKLETLNTNAADAIQQFFGTVPFMYPDLQ
jgi:hypothetical protein